MGTIPPPFPNGKGAGRVMGLVIFHSKATFVSGGFSFSPWGRRERGFPVLHYNPAMPIKNIIPGQTVTKEKLQRDPLRLRHLPQIRRCIFHMMIQSLNRRIWGRTGGGAFGMMRFWRICPLF